MAFFLVIFEAGLWGGFMYHGGMTSAPAHPKDLPILTSLRFFAAMVVVIHHFRYFAPFDLLAYTGFLHEGYLAVDFFFILSGFILTHVYAPQWQAGKMLAGDFIARRFARIYPLHFVTLLFMVGVALTPFRFGPVGPWPGEFPFLSLLNNFLMIQSWGMDGGLTFNVPSWSIAAEWFAYLCFPWLLPVMMGLRPGRALLVVAGLYAYVWLMSFSMDPTRPFTTYSFDCSILRVMPDFILGIALYRWSATRPVLGAAGVQLFAAACLAIALMHVRTPDIILIPIFCWMIRLGADMSRMPQDATGQKRTTWLARSFPVWLGDISYALYMVHYPVMVVVLLAAHTVLSGEMYAKFFPLLAMAVVLASVALSALLYRILEVPARRSVYTLLMTRTPLRRAPDHSK